MRNDGRRLKKGSNARAVGERNRETVSDLQAAGALRTGHHLLYQLFARFEFLPRRTI
jgi:hypothetical protein